MSIHAEPDERSGKRLGARLACAQRHKKARSVERALNPLVEYRGLEPLTSGLQSQRSTN